ncbi:MAG: hypothetical protein KAJ78_05025, partial [Acidobacteria bacterium]|nr:hypothetical protein [Acidobacteriota bacterium]
ECCRRKMRSMARTVDGDWALLIFIEPARRPPSCNSFDELPNSSTHQRHFDLVIPIDRTRKIDGEAHLPLSPRPGEWLGSHALYQAAMPPTSDLEPEIVWHEIPVTTIRYLDLDEVVP